MSADRIFEYVWSTFNPKNDHEICFLVDAARSKAIVEKLAAAKEEKVCLFRGEKAVEMGMVAPYLVELQPGEAFSRWLVSEGWGKSWGIFLISPERFVRIENHCRDLFQVYDEEGTPLLFRYYDPRVLRIYLPTCTARELKIFFGPVGRIVLEDEDPSALLQYQNLEGKLDTQKVRF